MSHEEQMRVLQFVESLTDRQTDGHRAIAYTAHA